MYIFIHSLKKKSDIKNSRWLNCLPFQNNIKTATFIFWSKLIFATPIIFYRILAFSASYHYFVERLFPLGIISLLFDLVNNPENSNLQCFQSWEGITHSHLKTKSNVNVSSMTQLL